MQWVLWMDHQRVWLLAAWANEDEAIHGPKHTQICDKTHTLNNGKSSISFFCGFFRSPSFWLLLTVFALLFWSYEIHCVSHVHSLVARSMYGANMGIILLSVVCRHIENFVGQICICISTFLRCVIVHNNHTGIYSGVLRFLCIQLKWKANKDFTLRQCWKH